MFYSTRQNKSITSCCESYSRMQVPTEIFLCQNICYVGLLSYIVVILFRLHLSAAKKHL